MVIKNPVKVTIKMTMATAAILSLRNWIWPNIGSSTGEAALRTQCMCLVLEAAYGQGTFSLQLPRELHSLHAKKRKRALISCLLWPGKFKGRGVLVLQDETP